MAALLSWRGRLTRGLGYVLFTLGVFVLSLWWVLPYPELSRALESRLLDQGVAARIEGLGPGTKDLEKARATVALRALSEAEWKALVPVGELEVKPILFRTGTAIINIQSKRDLAELAHALETWPQYYLRIVGHALAEGDPEANRRLAGQRADAVAAHLAVAGVSDTRIQAKAAPASAGG
ncbi:MAG: OmpA family protein, partial [Proteobacteria bacterium]|nr:OmpA family protein [Pseudomonadota bacterium]